jgi:hypothetical protein
MAWRTMKSVIFTAVIVSLPGFGFAADEAKDLDPALRAAIADAATTLQKGLATSEQNGKPISAKFEMSDGKAQISIYNATSDGFVETVIDPKTGAAIEAEQITDEGDLADAKVQKAATEKATVSLLAATDKAVKENANTKAVSIYPELQNGRPVAKIKLQGAKDLVTVTEPLS